jgi:thiamine biosynthesis protein ThiS
LVTVHVNGEDREIPEGLTLTALLRWLELPADRVAVEWNLEIVPRGRWDETLIRTGDKLEIVQFVGGG